MNFPELTTRENETIKLIIIGHTNQEIADQLNISIKTVDTHRTRAVKKLNVRNNVELVRLAIKRRVISIEIDQLPVMPNGHMNSSVHAMVE